jgi:hypothetical protein
MDRIVSLLGVLGIGGLLDEWLVLLLLLSVS